MKQPKMRINGNHTVYPVVSLVRLDNGKTLRAFPKRLEEVEGQPKSYVIIKGSKDEREPNATLILAKEEDTTKKITYKGNTPVDEGAKDMIERWNAKKILGQKDPYGKSHEVKGMKKCLKDTEVITQYKRLRKSYTHDEIMEGCSKYLRDVEDRLFNNEPTNYCHHRFSLYEFLKQSNGFIKFLSK